MTKYGRSPWLDTVSKARVPAYPSQRGAQQSPVVIVGGGLTGCATAYAFAASGVKVVLVEAGQVGRGSTGSATGWVGGDPGPAFVDVEKALGRLAARQVFQAWRRAALDFAALLRRLDIKCGFIPQGAAIVATTPDQAVRLKRDHKARRDAGLDAPLLGARVVKNELGLDAAAAIRDTAGGVLESLSRLPRPCRRSRRPRRDDLRAIAGAEDHVRPPEGRRHHGCRVDSRRSRGHRHRSADAALQVAGAAFLVSNHLSGDDGTGPREDPPAAWTPRRRRARSGGAAASRPMGGRGATAGRRSRHAVAAGPSTRQARRAADRPADVRAVDALSRHFGHPSRVRMGRVRTRAPPMDCPTSDRTGTSRIISLPSAIRATA